MTTAKEAVKILGDRLTKASRALGGIRDSFGMGDTKAAKRVSDTWAAEAPDFTKERYVPSPTLVQRIIEELEDHERTISTLKEMAKTFDERRTSSECDRLLARVAVLERDLGEERSKHVETLRLLQTEQTFTTAIDKASMRKDLPASRNKDLPEPFLAALEDWRGLSTDTAATYRLREEAEFRMRMQLHEAREERDEAHREADALRYAMNIWQGALEGLLLKHGTSE